MISRRGFLQVSGATWLGSQLPYKETRALPTSQAQQIDTFVTAWEPIVLVYINTRRPALVPGMRFSGTDPEIFYTLARTKPDWFTEIQLGGTTVGLVRIDAYNTTPDFVPIQYDYEDEDYDEDCWRLACASVTEILTPNTGFTLVSSFYHAEALHLKMLQLGNESTLVEGYFSPRDIFTEKAQLPGLCMVHVDVLPFPSACLGENDLFFAHKKELWRRGQSLTEHYEQVVNLLG